MDILYQEYVQCQREKDELQEKLTSQVEDLHSRSETQSSIIGEYETALKLVRSPDYDINSVGEKYSETVQKMAQLRVQESTASRQLNVTTARLSVALMERDRLKKDLETVEKTAFESINKLHRQKRSQRAVIDELQSLLAESITAKEYLELQGQYSRINLAYQDLLSREGQWQRDSIELKDVRQRNQELVNVNQELRITNECYEKEIEIIKNEFDLLLRKEVLYGWL